MRTAERQGPVDPTSTALSAWRGTAAAAARDTAVYMHQWPRGARLCALAATLALLVGLAVWLDATAVAGMTRPLRVMVLACALAMSALLCALTCLICASNGNPLSPVPPPPPPPPRTPAARSGPDGGRPGPRILVLPPPPSATEDQQPPPLPRPQQPAPPEAGDPRLLTTVAAISAALEDPSRAAPAARRSYARDPAPWESLADVDGAPRRAHPVHRAYNRASSPTTALGILDG